MTILYGDSGTGELLMLTQVVLSLQLSFAVFPLVMFTVTRSRWASRAHRSGSQASHG
ncbi:hypothetical protein AGR2A_Cc120203 [Agrobacterium genomosp. 2 str. CFBP 5494]|uniref:Uncharacterized protein n=1 Tax=Agrobacterium genomosp. 2 str. CFBP 5494 TaxID=1183436 RepID=A0A9W5EY58_9HYPH|nr:hypothetical protein AGR2A_Cc120203 [Agrobacterium genomosp. 2 str. CFBP 5494]